MCPVWAGLPVNRAASGGSGYTGRSRPFPPPVALRAPDALDHHFRRSRIGEIGEQHDQRAAFELGRQRRQREREIGLGRLVIERGE